LDHLVIQYDREASSIVVLAHVLVGEPDSTSPGHALDLTDVIPDVTACSPRSESADPNVSAVSHW
jgi:hypothetical protein